MPDFFYKDLVSTLLTWHAQNLRDLPWKSTRDPYKIWLSEIILQQTQVSQGIPYYQDFSARYPTVHKLAAATEDEVLKAWQGLGYNSRARNLLRAARIVSEDYSGSFPDTSSKLQDLPGIGQYTASAIASFAYEEATPVVDVNVIRVMSRILGIDTDPTMASTKAILLEALMKMIVYAKPSEFNQAMMDFGALQCVARNPDCDVCPFQNECMAHNTGMVETIPYKKPKKKRRERTFHYFLIYNERGILLRKRSDGDIWAGMYDFPGFEKDADSINADQIESFLHSEFDAFRFEVGSCSSQRQTLTHQKIKAFVHQVRSDASLESAVKSGYILVEFEKLVNFAVPKIIDCYLSPNSILLYKSDKA